MIIRKRLVVTAGTYLNKDVELLLYLDEHNHPIEIHVEASDSPSLVGSIFAARVMRVHNQTNSMFLRAKEQEFFCPIVALEDACVLLKAGNPDRLCQGDLIAVKVTRDATGGKPAKASALIDFDDLADLDCALEEGLVSKGEHPFIAHIRRLLDADATIDEIVTDSTLWQSSLLEYGLTARLYADEDYPLSKLYNIETMLEQSISPKVYLPSGGFLLIEPTSAMTVIDVNSGKNISKKSAEDYALSTNLEAATEIARQLRLRNLSGIIIVDFINLTSPEPQQTLLSTMKEAVKGDFSPVTVVDYTKLGLMELTRKRVYASLYEKFS